MMRRLQCGKGFSGETTGGETLPAGPGRRRAGQNNPPLSLQPEIVWLGLALTSVLQVSGNCPATYRACHI